MQAPAINSAPLPSEGTFTPPEKRGPLFIMTLPYLTKLHSRKCGHIREKTLINHVCELCLYMAGSIRKERALKAKIQKSRCLTSSSEPCGMEPATELGSEQVCLSVSWLVPPEIPEQLWGKFFLASMCLIPGSSRIQRGRLWLHPTDGVHKGSRFPNPSKQWKCTYLEKPEPRVVSHSVRFTGQIGRKRLDIKRFTCRFNQQHQIKNKISTSMYSSTFSRNAKCISVQTCFLCLPHPLLLLSHSLWLRNQLL